jgi:hypothetical protein
MTMLNEDYYKYLLKKFEIREIADKTANLTAGLLLTNFDKFNIHINFSTNEEVFEKTIDILHKKLSIFIFNVYHRLPALKKGSEWTLTSFKRIKRKNYAIKSSFFISNIFQDSVTLKDQTGNYLQTISVEKLYEDYYNEIVETIPKQYEKFFIGKSKNICVNWKSKFGFIPISFDKKIVFIAKKSFWDILNYKEKIPSIYLPNSHKENQAIIRSIPELEDYIAYFTPKYEICYDLILEKNIKIETIVVCDNSENIPQIIQDQASYGFKLIVLSNDTNPIKYNGLTLWNWEKEEIELIEKL